MRRASSWKTSCRGRRHGEEPRLAEYKERFPQHEKSMAALVSIRSIVGPAASAALTLRLPGAGVEIFGFRLKSSLGRGAFASVWLSEQANLAGRHVVLKVSAIEGDEPQTLAQLQHTSIVPIYSVHEDHAAGLRSLHALLWRIESRKRLAATLANLDPFPQGERIRRGAQSRRCSRGR